MNEVVQFGSKEFKPSDLFSAKAPTDSEVALFCHTLKTLIQSRVKILDAFQLMTKSTEHPWLLSILYYANEKLREGSCITDSIASGFKEMISLRIEQINARESQPGNWREFEPGEWAIPDFFGELSDLISMIEVGEETGELDTALGHVRDMRLGKGGYGEMTWGQDIAILNRSIAMMYVAGLPLRTIVRILQTMPLLQSLRSELEIVADSIAECDSLAEGFAKTNGRLADPIYLGLIEAGERAGSVSAVFDGMRIE